MKMTTAAMYAYILRQYFCDLREGFTTGCLFIMLRE